MTRTLPAIHPGEVLREEFMLPLELSANRLAQALHVPANRITSISNGTRGVSADTAMRLGAFFDTTPLFWMNLQRDYDLEIAEAKKGAAIRKRIAKRPPEKPLGKRMPTRTTARKRPSAATVASRRRRA